MADDVEFVVVASRQRSSSSYLAWSIVDAEIANGAVAYSFDEPWEDSTRRKANIAAEELVPNLTYAQRISNPLGFVRQLRDAYCRRNRSIRGARCLIVFKLFDVHFAQSPQGKASIPAVLAQLFSFPGARTVVLERDPIDELCSLKFAERSHQWWLPDIPNKTRAVYEKFKQNQCNHATRKSESDLQYLREHREWYQMVHAALRQSPASSYLNATYDDNVGRHAKLMAHIHELLATGRRLKSKRLPSRATR
jgi:hypothetical protein